MKTLFASALGIIGLAIAVPAAAQESTQPDYLQCFDAAAPADIATLNLNDYLADLRRGAKPTRDFWAEFENAWGGCADMEWSEEQETAARSYVMNVIGLRGATDKMATFGLSEPYMTRLTEMGQAPSDDGIWTDEVEAQFLVEQEQGTIDQEEARIFVEVVVMYVGSLRDLSAGPPAL